MPMNRTLLRVITRTHRFMYRISDGRLGNELGGRPMLMLTTTGRKSGQPRTTPLLYMPYGDAFLVVASNGGSEKPPAWGFNVKAKAEAVGQVGREKIPVRAEQADAERRAELWPKLVDYYPDYQGYQDGVEREIPVVVLRRA